VISIARSHLATITASGEAVGFGGATADRGSQLTIDRTLIQPTGTGAPGICIVNSSTLAMTNSVIANTDPNQPALGCWNVANSAHLNPAGGTVAFTTFFAAPIACQNATATAPTAFHFTNNIIVAPGSTKDVATGSFCDHKDDIATPQTADPPGANNIKGVDPMLRDPVHGDFHLLPGSPAINRADPSVTTDHDFDGVSRPQGAADDIGAFEVRVEPMPHL
jgi:hypothetical protein